MSTPTLIHFKKIFRTKAQKVGEDIFILKKIVLKLAVVFSLFYKRRLLVSRYGLTVPGDI